MSTDLTTSFGVKPPKRSLNFQQVSAVVDNLNGAKIPSWLLANGSSEVSDFSISKCKNERCKTCPKLEIKSFFYSNVTGKKHFVVNPS